VEPIPDFDLYAELEVSTRATTPTIEAAWRSLMKRNHPDIGGPIDADRAKRINIAHDWLTDPEHRAEYDRARTYAGGPQGLDWEGRRGSGGQTGPARPTGPTTRPAPSMKLGGIAEGRPYRGGRDVRRAGLAIGVALAVIGGWRVFLVVEGIDYRPSTEGSGLATVDSSPTDNLTEGTTEVASPSMIQSPGFSGHVSSSRPSGAPGPKPTPTPLMLTGSGNRAPFPMTLKGTAYGVDYVVTSPQGAGCSWSFYITDSSGYDDLIASAYPYDGTDSDTASDAGLAEGPATARVESDCPAWKATVSPVPP
jgi:hypothetical protein